MMFSRLKCLTTVAVCALCLLTTIGLSSMEAQPAPAPQTPAAQPPPAQTQQPQATPKRNPFESVPTGQAPDKPPAPKPPGQIQMEAPKPGEQPKPATTTDNVIDSVEFRGSRRVPQETLRALTFTKKGDKYDEE